MDVSNLFGAMPAARLHEVFEELLKGHRFRLERIVSHGQSTPPGAWLEQEQAEWVVLLQGGAGLLFEGEPGATALRPGDCVLIPARTRHRVQWTAPEADTIWLALHHQA